MARWTVLILAAAALAGCHLAAPKNPASAEKKLGFPPLEVRGSNPAIQSGALTLKSADDLNELPLGSWTAGTWGDIVLANERIRCVFANPQAPANQADRPGALIDLVRQDQQRDSLGAILPTHGSGLRNPMRFLSMTLRASGYPNNAAAVVIEQESRELPGLRATTEFILEPGADYLSLVTTWENATTAPLQNLLVGDLVYFGDAIPFLPGHGVIQPGKTTEGQSEFLAGLTPLDTFALAAAKPVRISGNGKYVNAAYAALTIEKGAKQQVERRIFLGGRDMSAVAERIFKYQQLPFGWLVGRLVEVGITTDKKLVDRGAIPDAEIRVICAKRNGKFQPQMPYLRTFTNSSGEFVAALPEGTWHLDAAVPAHINPGMKTGLEVTANTSTAADLTVGPASRIEIRVTDSLTKAPIPCKITIQSMINTPPVDFGPPDSLQGNNAVYTASGYASIKVPEGNYQVSVSHGIEYNTFEKIIRVPKGRPISIEAELEHVVQTPGWISVDVGVKTRASRGCLVSPEDRLTAAAAEGVEWLVTGDDNTATDLSAALAQTALSPYLRTSIGCHFAKTDLDPWGDFLVFPLAPDAAPPSGINMRSMKNPGNFFSAARSAYPGALLAVSRPLVPLVGYYNAFGWKADDKILPKSSRFSRDYDLLEVWEGKRLGGVRGALHILWGETAHGRRFVPYGASYSDAMQVDEVGYPRMYVAVANDDPARVSEAEIVESIRAGRVIITNGPFVDFRAEGQGPGSLVQAKDGYVNTELKVWAAPWVSTYSFEVYQNGDLDRGVFNPSLDTNPLRYPNEARKDKASVRVPCSKDCVLMAIVSGSQPLSPYVSSRVEGQDVKVLPYAITAPIYVDADGDGKFNPPAPAPSAKEEGLETEK